MAQAIDARLAREAKDLRDLEAVAEAVWSASQARRSAITLQRDRMREVGFDLPDREDERA